MEIEPCLQQGKRSPNRRTPGPDGLEAWGVALAACFINFVMAGLGRMSGILYVALIDIFETDRMQASLPFSVRSATRNLLGPVVGILGQKYGVRPIVIIGGVLGTLSAAACFFVEDITWMTVVWGFFNGIGTSLTTTLPQVTIGQHFKKYRSTASGIAFSGGCVGSIFFPALMEYLLKEYHLGGTFLIIAGIIMQVIPAAMILKKPTWLKERRSQIQVCAINGDADILPSTSEPQNLITSDRNDLSQTSALGFTSIKCVPKTGTACDCQNSREELNNRKIDTNLLWENRKLVIRLLTDDFTLKTPFREINRNKSFTNNALINEIEDLFCNIGTDVQNDVTILEKDSIADISVKANGKLEDNYAQLKCHTYINGCAMPQQTDLSDLSSNSLNCLLFYLENLFERDRNVIVQSFSEGEHETVSNLLEELWNIYIILSNNKRNAHLRTHSANSLFMDSNSINFEDSAEYSNTFCSHIKAAFKLHIKPLFLLICLCRTVHFLTFMPVVTTVVDFSMDKGLLAEDGKYVIAALSIGDLLGRLCFGWITDKGYVTLPKYMLFVMVLQGASTAVLSLMYSRVTLMSAIAVFGMLQGSVFVRHPVLVSRYVGSHEQSIAMGCINFFSGIVSFVLPSYIGFFRDYIGSYNGIFYINGAIGAFIGLLWVFEPYFLKFSRSSERRNPQASV